MEVPPESSPEHHRNLPRRRDHRLVVAGRGIDNVGDIKTVAVQGRGRETSDVVAVAATGHREASFRASTSSFFSRGVLRSLFAVYYDRPAGWKGRARARAVRQRVVGLEGDPAENRRDGEREAIGQMAGIVSHGDGAARQLDFEVRKGCPGLREKKCGRTRPTRVAFLLCPSLARGKRATMHQWPFQAQDYSRFSQ